MQRVLPETTKPKPLLVPRNAAARMLACNARTLMRLEDAGELEPVRPFSRRRLARVYYRLRDIEALAENGVVSITR